ncbi:MAG: DUF4340 domain-containing protein [Chitinophagales bacterium]
MNRNLLYLLLLGALGAAAYFYVIKKPSSTLNEKDKSFAVEDTAAIFKIFIADMEGKKVILQRGNNTWMVNNKYEVRNDYMKTLLSTIKRLNVSYPVPEAAEKTVITSLASSNKKVELYDKEGKAVKSYFVGGGTLNSEGTYFLMDGSAKPYVVTVPAFEGVLDTRYVADEEVIRSTAIFRLRSNEISRITVDYSEKPDSSFSIAVIGVDSFLVTNNKNVTVGTGQLSKERLQNYLGLFSSIYAETFVNDLPKKDSILQTKPFCTITLTDRQQKSQSITCYHMLRNSTSEQFDAKGNELKYDVDRYFATMNNKSDFVILQQFHFGRLFKNFSYFSTKSTGNK